MPGYAPLQPGDPTGLAGYRLIARLGEGGQGVVYLAAKPSSGERVAIKVLQAWTIGNAQARTRFAREVTAARRVGEFCTARVLAADVEGAAPYLVSEFIDGISLLDAIQRGGPMGGADLDRLAIGMATALAAIHRAGIVHRDFKPANVLLSSRGPRVVDFGIARALDSASTLTSQAIGTPAYMAPEQLRGGTVGLAADVFAWAGTVAFAATGTPPFGNDSVPAVVKRITRDEPMLTGLSGPLAATVAWCLAKDPAARPTAEALLLHLLGRASPAATADSETTVDADGDAGDGADAEDTLVVGSRIATALEIRPDFLPPVPRFVPPATVPPGAPGVVPPPLRAPASKPSRRRLLLGAGALVAATAVGGGIALAVTSGDSSGGSSGDRRPGGGLPGGASPGGRTLWHHDLETANLFNAAVGAGTLFLQDVQGQRLFAVDAATGNQRWAWKFQTTALAASGAVVYLADSENLYGLDATTGRRRWLSEAPADPGRLGLAGDLLLVTAGTGAGAVVVRGLRAADGRTRWTRKISSSNIDLLPDTDVLTVSPQVAVIGNKYTVTGLATATGNNLWHFAPNGSSGGLGRPLAMADTVYVDGGSGSGIRATLWALDAATGKIRWRSPHGTDRSSSTPFVASADTVYVTGADSDVLFALDARSGRERWRYSPGYPNAVVGDTLYASNADFEVIALDAATGRLRWRWDEGKKTRTDPFYRAASDNAAFYTLGAGSGDLYALRAH